MPNASTASDAADLAGVLWDAVVIGGGPSGLFAAHTVSAAGGRVLLIEAGEGMYASLCPRVRAAADGRAVRDSEKFRLQCARCDCLTGVGGAAFHFDTNLGYTAGLTRSKIETGQDGTVATFSGLERALGGFDRADASIRGVYDLFYGWGLPRAEAEESGTGPAFASPGFALADTAASQSITVDDALVVVGHLVEEVAERGGRLVLGQGATRVARTGGTFEVTLSGGAVARARNVIVAAGKLGLTWVRGVLSDLGVEHTTPRRVDLGVRIESWREDLAPLTDGCHNPKLSFLNERSESVRTFCVCPGGRLMEYGFAGTTVLDGQHCLTTPTTRTNFGVVTTVNVRDGVDGTTFALDFARRVNAAGEGGSVVQSVGDFLGVPTGGSRPVVSSLLAASDGDLATALGKQAVDDVAGMIERLNGMSDGMIGPHALIAGPVAEKVYPSITLTGDLESSVPGLYFVGDASSKVIGVTYGAVTGQVAATAAMAR